MSEFGPCCADSTCREKMLLVTLCFTYVSIASAQKLPTHRDRTVTPWVPSLINHGLESFVPSGKKDGSLCTEHGRIYEQHLRNLTLWAVQMVDASSKGPSGLLTGNSYQFGDFDQCVRIHEPTHNIRGKYVVVNFKFWKEPPDDGITKKSIDVFQYPSSGASTWEVFQVTKDRRILERNVVHWALCVPDSCDEGDIEQGLSRTLDSLTLQMDIRINSTVDPRFTYSKRTYTSSEDITLQIFIGITLTMIVLVIVATVKDLKRGSSGTGAAKCLAEDFSIVNNWNKLVRCDNHEFPAISGMKTWSMFFIIYGHRMMLSTFSPLFNQADNEMLVGDFLYTIVKNGALVVNTFLVITGFLTYNKMIKDVGKSSNIDILKYTYHRWIRLTPLYAYVMAFAVVVAPRISEGGPLGRGVIFESRCTTSTAWWTHLLYINNYVFPSEQCLIPSWYLAVDMQMYVLCAVCGFILWIHRRTGIAVLISISVISVVVPGIAVFQKNYNGIYLFYFDDFKTLLNNSEFIETYMYTHNRASPYVLGMLASYIYDRINAKKVKWSSGFVWTLFATAATIHLITWLGAWFFYLPDRPFILGEHVSYAILHRVGWSFSVSVYIIIAAYTRFAPLKYTIEAKMFRPLSTLSYAALLIHTPLQLLLAGSLRSPPYYNTIMSIWMACGDILFSYIAALFLYLFIEAPLARLKDLRIRHINNFLRSSHHRKEQNFIEEKSSGS